MLLAIDAGNTNTVFALFRGHDLVGQWRLSTSATRTADEYGVWLVKLMELQKLNAKDVRSSIIASVVPSTVFDLRMLCRKYFTSEALVIGDENVKLGIEAKVDRPSEVGADRLVNAHAAWNKYKKPLIIVDFGTATTFDVVDNSGAYVGGVIAPGINLSLEALHQAAAKLPNVAIAKPAKVIGTDTVGAMQSGIYYGYVGLIEGIVARIREELGINAKVVATGGLAPLYSKATKIIESLEPDLTIWGLKEIYELNS